MIPSVTFVRFIDEQGKPRGQGTRVTFANGIQVTFAGHVPKGLALRLAFEMFAPRPRGPDTGKRPAAGTAEALEMKERT